MKKQYILFDLDGTLTDPAEGITKSVQYALEKFGIIEEDLTKLQVFIGPPLMESFMDFYGFSEEQAREAVTYYREYFKPTGIFQNEVYKGIPELLKELTDAGKTLILATSKPVLFAEQILEYFDLRQYFEFIGGSDIEQKRAKKSEILQYILEECQLVDLTELVMVGDRKHDIVGAKQFGIDTVGVLYGYGSEEELTEAGADVLVESVRELGEYLLEEE
ncbi:MAG: HAD family hydrolase [Lachnospiraceae bacterium]|nr:HAD family hydrolase [Lachnospiraceae bacterium]